MLNTGSDIYQGACKKKKRGSTLKKKNIKKMLLELVIWTQETWVN